MVEAVEGMERRALGRGRYAVCCILPMWLWILKVPHMALLFFIRTMVARRNTGREVSFTI